MCEEFKKFYDFISPPEMLFEKEESVRVVLKMKFSNIFLALMHLLKLS